MFSIIGDMYFVHERGVRVALLTLCISALANLPAVLSGLITETLGWRWMFWMLAIFLAIGWVLVLLFGEETAFNRHSIFDTDISSVNVSARPLPSLWFPSDLVRMSTSLQQ